MRRAVVRSVLLGVDGRCSLLLRKMGSKWMASGWTLWLC